MWQRTPYNPGPYDDDWEDQPGQGPFYQWFMGAALPLAILAYGICVITTHEATFGANQFQPMQLEGPNATALGVAAVSLGLFLHCHYFWGNIYNQAWFAVLGKILAACGFIAGLAILLIRVGIMGRN
jgi:hypothetical protein